MAKFAQAGMARSRKKETGAPQAAGDTTVANPDRERVAMRAYELYLARGGGDGQAMDDWLIAERELTAPAAGEKS
jgi:hypothetical protein